MPVLPVEGWSKVPLETLPRMLVARPVRWLGAAAVRSVYLASQALGALGYSTTMTPRRNLVSTSFPSLVTSSISFWRNPPTSGT